MPNSLTLSSMRMTSRALTADALGSRNGDPRHNEDLCLNLLIEEGHTRYGITLSPEDARQLAGWINEAFPLPKNAREVIDTLPVGTCFRLAQAEVVQFYRKGSSTTIEQFTDDTFDTPVDGGQRFLDTASWLFTGWPVSGVTVYEPRTTTIYVPKEG